MILARFTCCSKKKRVRRKKRGEDVDVEGNVFLQALRGSVRAGEP